MSSLYKKLLESLSNFNIDEDEKPKKSKPTDTAEKPASKPADDIFKQKPDQPIVPKDDKAGEKKPEAPQPPSFKRSSQSDTLRRAAGVTPTDQMRDMLSRMRDVEADPDDPGYPQPTRDVTVRVTPENLPAVVNDALTDAGVLNPDWHVVANLPGNMAQAIRTVGRRLFRAMTRTPTDEIVMIANLQGMGPNTPREINAVASWLRNTGREVSTGSIDFDNFIPGYQADIKMYDAAGARFLLVRDFAGQYIYTWPQNDSVEMNNAPRLGR